jgi:hypothetical protein
MKQIEDSGAVIGFSAILVKEVSWYEDIYGHSLHSGAPVSDFCFRQNRIAGACFPRPPRNHPPNRSLSLLLGTSI